MDAKAPLLTLRSTNLKRATLYMMVLQKRLTKKKVNSKDYWFRPDGVMLAKFYMIGDNMYYFGGSDDGSMKTGSQTVKDNTGDSYKFYFYTKDSYGCN